MQFQLIKSTPSPSLPVLIALTYLYNGLYYHTFLIVCVSNGYLHYCRYGSYSLLWRNNGQDGISNHQAQDCLLNRLFRRRSKKTPKLRVTGICAENSPVTGEFPAQMASAAKMLPFDDVIMPENIVHRIQQRYCFLHDELFSHYWTVCDTIYIQAAGIGLHLRKSNWKNLNLIVA